MGKGEKKDDELNKDNQKRLAKLEEDWEKPLAPYSLGGLSAADLRLLFENFPPLQALVRRIVADPVKPEPVFTTTSHPATALPANMVLRAEGLGAESQSVSSEQLAIFQRELAQAQSERQQALNQSVQLKHECVKAHQDLSDCNSAVKQLQQENKGHKQTIKTLEKQLKDLEAAHASTPPELTLLRADAELTGYMGLATLPADDTQALIQVVAVLAQRDNLERLWGFFRGECESDKRPASAEELALLKSAVAWHNHNWLTRPYRLIEVAPGNAYHYEQHLRSRNNSKGETVAALLLPGIVDGVGHILCKALVDTR